MKKSICSALRKAALCCLLPAACCLASCQESWQERAVRETREMTLSQCPHYITPGLIVDSLAFTPADNTRHSYYTLVDSLVNIYQLTEEKRILAHQSLVDEVCGSVGLRTLKKHRVTFAYHYRLLSTGQEIVTDSVTASEY